MEIVRSFDMSVNSYQTTRCHMAERIFNILFVLLKYCL
jgi:hypothetical protein